VADHRNKTVLGRRQLGTMAAAGLLSGCAHDQALSLKARPTADARGIDQRPLDLLPDEALLVSHLQVDAIFASGLSSPMGQLLRNLVPVGPASGFVPERDVHHLYGGTYAMQGADVVAVVQGTFNQPAIESAAAAPPPTGPAIVATTYGPYVIHTRKNMGFVVLTPHTLIIGNETALRRTLDRLRYGRFEATLPDWIRNLIGPQRQGAAFAVAGDVSRQGVVGAASGRLPFVQGLRQLRLLGNFQAPGINLVGTLTYGDEAQAQRGASGLGQAQQLAYFASLFSTFGLGGQMPPLEAQARGKDVAFATKVDTPAAAMMMNLMVEATKPG